MKKLAILFVFGILLIFSCDKKESCGETTIPEHKIEFRVEIVVVNDNDVRLSDYAVNYRIQKTFCDDDVGFPIEANGITDYAGYFSSSSWDLPYTNSKDYVTVYVSTTSGGDEIGYSKKYYYNDVKNLQSGVKFAHTFTVN